MAPHVLAFVEQDEPQAVLKDGVPERPLFGYCRDDTTGDILIPNMDNGNIFLQPRSRAAYRPKSRAGPKDPRQPRVLPAALVYILLILILMHVVRRKGQLDLG